MAALRFGYTVLDATEGFRPAGHYQQTIATACFNFVGSEYSFSEIEMNMLIRSLQHSSPEERERFFVGVRSCRRRKQVPWQKTPLTALFTTKDGYELLDTRAMLIRIKHLILEHGMLVFDAFRAFNHNKDGTLTCSELYGGLTWLGLELEPEQVHSIVRRIDTDNDGLVSFEEFKAAFYDPIAELEAAGVDTTTKDAVIEPREMPELVRSLLSLILEP